MPAGRAATGSSLLFLVLWACAPTPSPADGHDDLVLFASDANDAGDILAVPLLGGPLQMICAGPGPQGSPRIRPAQQSGVYADFATDPAEARRLPGCESLGPFDGEALPVWLPQSDRVSAGNAESGDVTLASALGRPAAAPVIMSDAIERYPAWSGDETRLAFARRTEAGWSLVVHEMATGQERVYLDGATYLGHPAWSPNNDRLAFDMFVDGDAEIFTLELASGEARRWTARPGHDLASAWSSTGQHLVFTGLPADSEARDIFRIDLGSGAITNLTTSPANETGPVILPASWLED
ncbi:hypothetical protein [uncultured Maricaulis sp.]|uniref:TolB family protein n=1 Tax=uncultured Maricaulis sp. TaxID=174710 RepID=UPI00260C5DCB|nr:hypothetical protein [uncultured Maricaulis sp.]